MIKIRKTDGGEIFDLPPGYVIEAEKNNPLFSNKGSQTVPVNFPTTDKNNRLLDFPFRIDRTSKPNDTIPVIVETGSVQQKGLLSVNSASGKVISATIGYDESEMYAVMKDMQLRDMPILSDPKFIKSFGGNNTNEKVDSMLAHLTAVYKQQTEAEYYVFPVIVKKETTQSENLSKTYLEIINEPDAKSLDINNLPNGKIAELKALNNRTIVRYENGQEIQLTVPKGYGVSPFLKVYRILEIIFLNFGFNITENPFKDHRQLKKMVALNNTIDAVLTGTLYYKDLMQDCTILEFLDSLYAKFGMLYFADSNSKAVRIKFLKDILNPKAASGSVDLNPSKTQETTLAFQQAKQLRLKMNRELEDANTAFSTMEEFIKRFDYQFTERIDFDDGTTQIFRSEDCKYLILNIFTSVSQGYDIEQSSDFFDWDKKSENINYEDIEMKDLCLPFYKIGGTLGMQTLQYLVGFKHGYSDIFVGGTKQEEIGDQAKIAFAFAWGLTSFRSAGLYSTFFASQFNRNSVGNFISDEKDIKYDISLTCNREDGLYNRFWKEYDAFLRHSNQQITCNLHLSDNDFVQFKMYEKAFINNQPVIAEQIKYKFNDTGDKIAESTFRTLRLYEPFDLIGEQKIPNYFPQKYFWAFTTQEIGIGVGSLIRTDFDSFYTVNGVQIPVNYLSYLPPTEAQFASQETRIFKYRKYYSINHVEITVTYKPALI